MGGLASYSVGPSSAWAGCDAPGPSRGARLASARGHPLLQSELGAGGHANLAMHFDLGVEATGKPAVLEALIGLIKPQGHYPQDDCSVGAELNGKPSSTSSLGRIALWALRKGARDSQRQGH